MPDAIVSAASLAKSFGLSPVLENVSFEIRQGERYGLVGLNGAGKTTLIRLLLGVLRPDSGSVSVLGSTPWAHDGSLFRRLGVVLEHDGFWGNLTFDQNMRIFAEAKGVAWKAAAAYLEEHWSAAGLYETSRPVKLFSRGQRMQCAIARAFLGWPAVCFFDEPAVSLDVGAYEHLKRLVKAANDRGTAFLISSHQLEAIDDLCARVGILRDGRLDELVLGAGTRGERWLVAIDKKEEWGAIIGEVCGTIASWHGNEWEVVVTDSSVMIPRLVRRLVEAGCDIRKVAPASGSFSDTIRREYRESAS